MPEVVGSSAFAVASSSSFVVAELESYPALLLIVEGELPFLLLVVGSSEELLGCL